MTITQQIATAVAIQGGEGSFHDLAARQWFGPDSQRVRCDTFPELFTKLNSGEVGFGAVAIENSVAGTLLPNYAQLRNSDLKIIGEVYLRIEHHLQALPGQRLEDIREVRSHPMALMQCSSFLDSCPHIKVVESHDTADSSRIIREQVSPGVAAIASRRAAEIYGLQILAEGIENNPRNYTRFLILGHPGRLNGHHAPPSKASLSFKLAHKVGSLAQVLMVLSSHGMNLCKIQSLPVVGKEWEYFFHIDLEFEVYEQYRRSLEAINHLVDGLGILGEYPRGEKRLENRE